MAALERLFHRSGTNDMAMKRVSSRQSEFVSIDQLLLRIKVPRWTNRGTRARTRNALSFKTLGGAITCVLPIEDAAAHCAIALHRRRTTTTKEYIYIYILSTTTFLFNLVESVKHMVMETSPFFEFQNLKLQNVNSPIKSLCAFLRLREVCRIISDALNIQLT